MNYLLHIWIFFYWSSFFIYSILSDYDIWWSSGYDVYWYNFDIGALVSDHVDVSLTITFQHDYNYPIYINIDLIIRFSI